MKRPKITCVMTVFNEKDFVAGSIGSVLRQNYDNLQLIVVDDGSNEATVAELEKIDDPRVLIVHQANDGLSGARNKGLEQVQGDYVCFLDADDCRPAWAFDVAAGIIERDEPDLIVCPGVLSEINGELKAFYDQKIFGEAANRFAGRSVKITDKKWSEAIQLAQLAEPQSANKFIRTGYLKSIKAAFPNSHFFEDMLFHSACVAQAQSIAFADAPCFTYHRRYVINQITSSISDIRFDAVSVAKVTFELMPRLPHFHDQLYRAAVVMSTFRLLKWSEENTSHHYRFGLQQMLIATMRLIDQLYAVLPAPIPPHFHLDPAIESYARNYLGHTRGVK